MELVIGDSSSFSYYFTLRICRNMKKWSYQKLVSLKCPCKLRPFCMAFFTAFARRLVTRTSVLKNVFIFRSSSVEVSSQFACKSYKLKK